MYCHSPELVHQVSFSLRSSPLAHYSLLQKLPALSLSKNSLLSHSPKTPCILTLQKLPAFSLTLQKLPALSPRTRTTCTYLTLRYFLFSTLHHFREKESESHIACWAFYITRPQWTLHTHTPQPIRIILQTQSHIMPRYRHNVYACFSQSVLHKVIFFKWKTHFKHEDFTTKTSMNLLIILNADSDFL